MKQKNRKLWKRGRSVTTEHMTTFTLGPYWFKDCSEGWKNCWSNYINIVVKPPLTVTSPRRLLFWSRQRGSSYIHAYFNLGLDTNITKNLSVYPEILNSFSLKISKYPQKFLKIPKYPKVYLKSQFFSELFFNETLALPWKENGKHICKLDSTFINKTERHPNELVFHANSLSIVNNGTKFLFHRNVK